MTGRDVIAQAQSGTGKTATFSISCLQNIDSKLNSCQALILSPTRELALQVSPSMFSRDSFQTEKVVRALGQYMKISCVPIIGGGSVKEDQAKLEKGVHIVVGTPGRVYDVIQRKMFGSIYLNADSDNSRCPKH